MKQLVQHEQCLRCHECCRFRADRQDFAPIFTAEELEAIRQVRDDLPDFTPFRGSDKVFQIRLKEAEIPHEEYPYVCPFLDEANYRCTIYEVRPFDCRIWPFIVLKVRETGQVLLAHFTGEACLAVQEAQPEDFAAYEAYMQQLVTSESFLKFLKKYPELIWEHGSYGKYVTIQSSDVTKLLQNSPGA